jgi:hypothetical protein
MSPKRFRLPMRDAKIIFEEGTTFAGAVVKCRLDVEIGMITDIQDLIESSKHSHAYEVFGDAVLIEWNLEDQKGNILPANGKGMKRVTAEFAEALMTEWMEAVTQVGSPLEQPSKNGIMSEELSGVTG